jgi:hypothetical protein
MQRDMSYELDDAFSSRNDGEVLLVDEPKPRVLRGGGSTNISRPNAVALRDSGPVESDDVLRHGYTPATGLQGTTVDLPLVGQVNLLHVGLGIAAGAALVWLLSKKD